MDILSKQGWVLTESGLKAIESSGNSKNLSKILLDCDLREIGAGIPDLHKGKFESLNQENAVLQIQKIRNISAPKANEQSKTAPKLLKLQLTDGINTYSAIEMEPTPLTLETKPGSKIVLKVKQMKMANGHLLLTPKNIEILGGNVEALVSKWELTKSLAGMKGSRTVAAGGPPPFIPFGQKIQQNLQNDQRGFKSLQASKTKESENDDSEFKAQRKDAIAEANKAGTKKTFGGGSKSLIDSNVQKIMDKGYTEEQATVALKFSRNNVEKALGNIKRKEEHQQRAGSYEPREYSKEKRGGGKGNISEPQSAKPSGAVSLFDFLENKISTQLDNAANKSYNERFENNMSSSFRKFDKDVSNNSQHWSQNPLDQKSSHNVKNSYNNNSRDNLRGGATGNDRSKDFRNYRDSRDVRDSDARRESRYQQPSNSYSTKSNLSSSNQYQKPTDAMNGSNHSYNSMSGSKGRYQKPDFNAKPATQHRDYNNFSSTGPGANNMKFDSNSNRSKGNNASSKYYNENQSNDYHKSNKNIAESMEKMNLKGNSQHHKAGVTKLNETNYPPLTPSAEVPNQKSFSKPGYQPIMGFQNKEANEHARNALKTKNIPGNIQQTNQHQSANWQHQKQSAPQHKMPVISSQTIKNQPPPPFPNAQQPAPTPLHSLPQPFVQHQSQSGIHSMPSPAVIPSPTTVFHPPINYPTPIILQSAPPPTAPLKIGDLCLAKYWEDAQYYNAKITNISDSTYVVLFTEYGNAEEVRKTDCLPLVSACPTPHASFVPAPQISSAYHIPTQKMSHNYQQPPPTTSTMMYKNGQGKNQRRN